MVRKRGEDCTGVTYTTCEGSMVSGWQEDNGDAADSGCDKHNIVTSSALVRRHKRLSPTTTELCKN